MNICCQILEGRWSKTTYLYWLNFAKFSFWMVANNFMIPFRIIKSTFIFVNTGTIQDSITQKLRRYWRHVHTYTMLKYFRMQMDLPKYWIHFHLEISWHSSKDKDIWQHECKYCDQSKVDEVLVSRGRYYHNIMIIVWYELYYHGVNFFNLVKPLYPKSNRTWATGLQDLHWDFQSQVMQIKMYFQ